MSETEIIIEAVRARRCLYDMSHDDFKRPDVKMNNWKQIENLVTDMDGEMNNKLVVLYFCYMYGLLYLAK